MRLSLRRRPVETPPPGIIATARVDPQTRALVRRLRPGDIAVVDHVDLDRVAAQALVAARPAAVVNAAASISGRFPALGAQTIVDAGIPLVDSFGAHLLTLVADGARVRLDGEDLHVGEQASIGGVIQTPERVQRAMAAARTGLDVQLEAVTATAAELLRHEHALLLDGSGAPALPEGLRNRPAVVVADGPRATEDLRALRRFTKDRDPALIGVERGADVLRAAGFTPHVVVGSFAHVSDDVLQCGAALVLHSRHAVRPDGLARAERLAVVVTPFPYAGRSDDAALLLAYQNGAPVIVFAGGADGLVPALDAGGTAMASTFLTQLAVGGRLASAQTVAAVHRPRVRRGLMAVLVACQLAVLGVAVDQVGGPGTAWHDLRTGAASVARDLADLVPGDGG
jgi:uncharacterized membrane-anchored protein